MPSIRLLSLTSLLAFGLSASAFAATISAGVPTPVANGGQAPGSATNYDFGDFGSNGQPKNLTNFAVTINANSQYPGVGQPIPYTTLIAPGGTTAFTTGIAYSQPNAARTALIASFSALTPGNFSVYVLDGNTDGNFVGNTFVGLGVNGGTAVSAATFYSGVNEFTRYDISGALTTDTFQLYATTGTANFPSLGGVTFSGAPTPEPSSMVFLGTGIIGAAGAARRKFRRS